MINTNRGSPWRDRWKSFGPQAGNYPSLLYYNILSSPTDQAKSLFKTLSCMWHVTTISLKNTSLILYGLVCVCVFFEFKAFFNSSGNRSMSKCQ